MEWLEPISKVAVIAGVVVATTGARIAYLKFRSDRSAQELANAMQIYRKYLELALQNPRLAEPEIYQIDPSTEEYSKYEWFVSILLHASEEILQHHLGDESNKEWVDVIKTQLEYHRKYLRDNNWFDEKGRGHYSKELIKLIAEVTKG